MKDVFFYLNAFANAVNDVFSEFGIRNIERGDLKVKNQMTSNRDFAAYIGIVGEVRGNVSYSFDEATAKRIAARIMTNVNQNELDSGSRKAIADMTGKLVSKALIEIFKEKKKIDMTPPTVINGKKVQAMFGNIKTYMIIMETTLGVIEINIGMEM